MRRGAAALVGLVLLVGVLAGAPTAGVSAQSASTPQGLSTEDRPASREGLSPEDGLAPEDGLGAPGLGEAVQEPGVLDVVGPDGVWIMNDGGRQVEMRLLNADEVASLGEEWQSAKSAAATAYATPAREPGNASGAAAGSAAAKPGTWFVSGTGEQYLLVGGVNVLFASHMSGPDIDAVWTRHGVAREHVSPLGELPNAFLAKTVSDTETLRLADALSAEPGIDVAVPNTVRPLSSEAFASDAQLTADARRRCNAYADPWPDELSSCQWHLDASTDYRHTFPWWDVDVSDPSIDINLGDAWSTTMGAGVTVAVVDATWNSTHEDLADNADNARSKYWCGRTGRATGEDHGTAVAGIVGARDNTVGGRGVAPRATLVNYNYMDCQSSANRAAAMTLNKETVAVSNHSYGWSRRGFVTQGRLWQEALETSLEQGFGGKGTSYVQSAGNWGVGDREWVSLDAHNNHRGIITVCALNSLGGRTWSSERGASLWVCAPSKDLGHAGILAPIGANHYTSAFSGTSAAAPIVSGVIALMRSVNADLTWRDVKVILADTAHQNDPQHSTWLSGAPKYSSTGPQRESYSFSHSYGFGLVDATAAVDAASAWTLLPQMQTAKASHTGEVSLPAHGDEIDLVLDLQTAVDFTEHVKVTVTGDVSDFRNYQVTLVSPSGAESILSVASHFCDAGWCALRGSFDFGSSRHLGENPSGTWKLRIRNVLNKPRGGGFREILSAWNIEVTGHTRPSKPITLPEVSVSAAGDVVEGSAAQFTVSASPKPAAGLDVKVTVGAVGDFGAATGSRTVTVPSSGSLTLTVATSGDATDEPDGSVSASLDVPAADAGYTVSPTAGSASVAVSDDDDPPPVVPVVSVSGGGGVTEGGDAIFTVSAVPKPAADLDVEVTVAAVGDFGAVAGAQTVTVPVSGSVKVTVATVGDSVDEADGSVSVSLDAPAADAGYTVSATAGSATVAVSDDDDPPPVVEPEPEADPPSVEADPAPVVVPVCTGSPELSVADASAVPGGMLVFGFSLSCRASGSVVAYYYLVRDGAIAGSTQAVRFAAGVTSGSASVAVGGSSAVSLTVVYAPGTARPFRGLKATGVIVETLPVVSVSAGAGVSEGADAVFTVSAVPAPTSPVNVVVDVSASGDFVVSSARRTVVLSGASATLAIATSDDAVDEADGSVTVTLVDGASYDVGTSRAATVSVADDDVPPPVVSITAGSGGAEGTSATFAVTASSAPAANLEVSVMVAATGDFGVAAGTRTATILAGTTGATLTVATADDSVDEPDGSVTATLAAGSGYTVGPQATQSAQIADDDDPPVVIPEVSVTAGGAVSEGAGAVFTVTASEPKSAAFDVGVTVSATGEWGVAGGSQTVSFAANAASATLTVPTVGDSVDEADGSVSVSLDAPAADAGYTVSATQSAASVAVADDDVDPLTVYMIFFARSIAEDGAGDDSQAHLRIAPTRALRSWETLTVPLRVTGGDEGTHWTMRDLNDPDAVFANEFEVVFGPGDRGVVLEPGDQRAELVLTAVDDSDWVDQEITVWYGTGARAPTLNGSTEGVTLGISWGPDGVERADGSTTVVIIDSDEPPPQIDITAATGGIEGTAATFTVTASAPTTADLDVAVDIASTGEWGATTGTRTVTIPQGATQATLTVATVDDSVDEPDGSITATLAVGSGYTVGPQATQSAQIADDDDPPPEPAVAACVGKPTVSVADATAARGDDLEFVVSLSCRSSGAVTVYYFISHGGGFSGGEIVTIDSGDTETTVSVPTAGVDQAIGFHVLYTIGAANNTAKATSTITD
ncbi:S8 family serine peptidase [Candidatus Poriferisodalis sp.]|uniref:S8 family serine peptidase n=1 Tax=Candidatus Poriferisodalis sp. TaxID=3101277 RepID=UPI003B014271